MDLLFVSIIAAAAGFAAGYCVRARISQRRRRRHRGM